MFVSRLSTQEVEIGVSRYGMQKVGFTNADDLRQCTVSLNIKIALNNDDDNISSSGVFPSI